MLSIGKSHIEVWGSAFKWAELPMRYLYEVQGGERGSFYMYKEIFSPPTSFNDNGCQFVEGVRQRSWRVIARSFSDLGSDVKNLFVHLYKKKYLIAIAIGTSVAFPMTIVLTPFSIVSDIFAGLIQASWALWQGADYNEVSSILYKKVIVSPIQQGFYFLAAAGSIGVLSGVTALQAKLQSPRTVFLTNFVFFTLFFSALMGPALYYGVQEQIAKFPRCLRPDAYNVFIEGLVSFDAEGDYQKWNQEHKKHLRKEQMQEFVKFSEENFNSFKINIREELDTLERRSEGKFEKIGQWLQDQSAPPYQLFDFSNRGEFTESDLKQAHNKLALIYHPDKCRGYEAEAAIWYRLLHEARRVEESIIKHGKKGIGEVQPEGAV